LDSKDQVDRARPFLDTTRPRPAAGRGSPRSHDPRDTLKLQDIVNASGRLQGTHLIRLFAEFETGLRLFWATIRDTEPPTQHLLDGIAARRGIPPDRLASAHAVREYRNALVHERDEAMAPISIAEARGSLCRFFAFLPPIW
jgi:hypothetical protein